jgi:hypothetical protein
MRRRWVIFLLAVAAVSGGIAVTPLHLLAGGPDPGAKPFSGFEIVRVKLNRKLGTATLVVKAQASSRVVVEGRGIRKIKRRTKQVSLVELPIEPVGYIRHVLYKTGKVKVRARLTFKPSDGALRDAAKTVKLTKVLGP